MPPACDDYTREWMERLDAHLHGVVAASAMLGLHSVQYVATVHLVNGGNISPADWRKHVLHDALVGV